MNDRRDAVIGVAWLVVGFVLIAALLVGLVKVLTDPTAANAYRWVLAVFFLAGPLAFLTLRYESTLRRFFRRR